MNLLNGLTLAYLGDAVYEVYVRDYLILKGITKVNDLHKEAIKYTSAVGQARVMKHLLEHDLLEEDEVLIYKRGRNATTKRKAANTDLATYHMSTGFEALIGYLYNDKRYKRIEYVFHNALEIEENR